MIYQETVPSHELHSLFIVVFIASSGIGDEGNTRLLGENIVL